MEQWIEEFCFRGRPLNGPGSEMPTEFCVIVARRYPHPVKAGEYFTDVLPPMTPAQAEAEGLTLSDLVADINAQAIDQVADYGAALALANDELAQLRPIVAERDNLLIALASETERADRNGALLVSACALSEQLPDLQRQRDDALARAETLAATLEALGDDLPAHGTDPV